MLRSSPSNLMGANGFAVGGRSLGWRSGDEPRLTFDGFAVVHELVYAPWVGKDGKIKRAFRATSVADASASGKSATAA